MAKLTRPRAFMMPYAGEEIHMDDFPRYAVEMDDAPSINRAIDQCILKDIATLRFGSKQYTISSQTVDFSDASGIFFKGSGFDTKGSSAVISGTRIDRTADIVAFKSSGGTVSTGGSNNRAFRMEGIRYSGGDFMSDFMQLIATAIVIADEVMFTASGGRHILLHEVMDSRFNESVFEWGGTADGTIPMLELKSGSGYEYTNQIHFDGVRMESYRGTALATSGSNTNEVYFHRTKMESLITNQPHLKLVNANVVNFGGLNICSKGTVGQTLAAQLVLDNSKGISGILQLEHTGTIDSTSAKIDRFVDIKNGCSDIDLYVYVYQNGTNTIASNPVMVDGASNADNINIRGSIIGSILSICNIHARSRNLQIKSSTPSLRLNYSPVTAWSEYWEHRLNGDGNGSKMTIAHNKDGTPVDIMSFYNSGDTHFFKNLYMDNYAFHLAQLASAPYGQNGSIYYDSTNNVLKAYINGAWKTVTVT